MDDKNFFPFFYELAGEDAPDKEYHGDNNYKIIKEKLRLHKDNEWQQEYHLIYNSYLLEYQMEYMVG